MAEADLSSATTIASTCEVSRDARDDTPHPSFADSFTSDPEKPPTQLSLTLQSSIGSTVPEIEGTMRLQPKTEAMQLQPVLFSDGMDTIEIYLSHMS